MRDGAEGKLYELGMDALPEGIEDIRGHIYSEPTLVFAVVGMDGELLGYVGIDKEQ